MDGAAKALLAKLGKHTTGKDCLYIKKLADVDQQVLEGNGREIPSCLASAEPKLRNAVRCSLGQPVGKQMKTWLRQ